MSDPVKSTNSSTLNDLMAVRGVGAQIMRAVPVLQRLRLRQVCRAFLSAVDESLESLSEMFWEHMAEAVRSTGGLDWLVDKCPNLRTLSVWSSPEVDYRCEKQQRIRHRLVRPGMATQSFSTLAHCTGLRSLNLAGCVDVGDDLLTALAASCRELESLDVSYCRVTDAGITEIALHCPGLKKLSARALKHVTDTSIEQVALCCGQLKWLDVATTNVTDAGVSAIAQRCPHLCHLALGQCAAVTDASMLVVAENCATLEELDVSGLLGITDASITAVAERCRQLKSLDLSEFSCVSNQGLEAVAEHCPQLEYLDVFNLDIRRSVMWKIARNCPRLRHLNAHLGPLIDDEVIDTLTASCPQLHHLSVSDSDNLTDDSVLLLAERCPQLEHLLIWACNRVTDVGISAIARCCPRLKHLDLWDCGNVTDASMTLVGEHCRQLEKLGISLRAEGVTDASLRVVGRNCARLRSFVIRGEAWGEVGVGEQAALRVIVEDCRQLEHLDVSTTSLTSDECMAAISRNCTNLRSFVASGCRSLTDRNLAVLLAGRVGASLLHLDLSLCDNITDKSLVVVGRTCRQLRTLNLHFAVNVTDAGIEAMAAGCRQLISLCVDSCEVTRKVLDMFDPSKCDVSWDRANVLHDVMVSHNV
eukprot:jgi/Mesvir1/21290/Mv21683-RA.1